MTIDINQVFIGQVLPDNFIFRNIQIFGHGWKVGAIWAPIQGWNFKNPLFGMERFFLRQLLFNFFQPLQQVIKINLQRVEGYI